MTPLALDIAIGLVITLSTVIAYLRGVIKEVFTLLGLFLAGYLAYHGGHLLVPEFNKLLNVPDGNDKGKATLILGILAPSLAAKVFSYGGVFLLVFVVMSLVGHLLTKWTQEAGMAIIDRVLGAGFGLLRGFLLVFLLYVPCTYLIDQKKLPDWAKESYSVPVLQKSLAWANTQFGLDKMIEDRGGSIAIKLEKVDLDKLGTAINPAEEELKKAIKKEEKEIQKGTPDTQPDQLLNKLESSPPEQSEPAPVTSPAPPPPPPPQP